MTTQLLTDLTDIHLDPAEEYFWTRILASYISLHWWLPKPAAERGTIVARAWWVYTAGNSLTRPGLWSRCPALCRSLRSRRSGGRHCVDLIVLKGTLFYHVALKVVLTESDSLHLSVVKKASKYIHVWQFSHLVGKVTKKRWSSTMFCPLFSWTILVGQGGEVPEQRSAQVSTWTKYVNLDKMCQAGQNLWMCQRRTLNKPSILMVAWRGGCSI